MHQPVRTDHFPSVHLADALVPEAYAKDRHFLSEFLNDSATDPRVAGSARPGRDADSGWRLFPDFVEGDLVVAMDLHFHTQLSKVLNQVVGERIVVIDDQ